MNLQLHPNGETLRSAAVGWGAALGSRELSTMHSVADAQRGCSPRCAPPQRQPPGRPRLSHLPHHHLAAIDVGTMLPVAVGPLRWRRRQEGCGVRRRDHLPPLCCPATAPQSPLQPPCGPGPEPIKIRRFLYCTSPFARTPWRSWPRTQAPQEASCCWAFRCDFIRIYSVFSIHAMSAAVEFECVSFAWSFCGSFALLITVSPSE